MSNLTLPKSPVGFKFNITFDKNSKITSYIKTYDNNYNKTIKIYLPLDINNKDINYICYLYASVNNTFPKNIIKIKGYIVENELNCYIFDITNAYKFDNNLGLLNVILKDNNFDCIKFKSDTFSL